MPLTQKGKEILSQMEKTYHSAQKAKEVFYASKNKGTISGVDKADSFNETDHPRDKDGKFSETSPGTAKERLSHVQAVLKSAGVKAAREDLPKHMKEKKTSGGAVTQVISWGKNKGKIGILFGSAHDSPEYIENVKKGLEERGLHLKHLQGDAYVVTYKPENESMGKTDSARRDAAMGVLDCVIDCMKADSKFEELVEKLEKKGYSHEYATKIAAKVGREKFGAKGMAQKAAAARK